ncbi:hypothetical protein TL16_g12825 [Triparma laevis f. inornata]|uniref:Uncharacterized protein n=1 Tax=Triparma laevis f. inornata TaxID=1714386 RepID=A0A9W7EXJ7_9STRA|nr:hypothetical protein TL16_g12825 [Triparma laevis f. inornata]
MTPLVLFASGSRRIQKLPASFEYIIIEHINPPTPNTHPLLTYVGLRELLRVGESRLESVGISPARNEGKMNRLEN